MRNQWSKSVTLLHLLWFIVPIFPLSLLLVACKTSLAKPAPAVVPTTAGEQATVTPPPDQAPPGQLGTALIDQPHMAFAQLSLAEGLSSNLVQAVLHDRQGFIWFGTLEGLNKYDGYTVTVYRPEPGNPNSLSDTVINGVYEDRAGNLWVTTTNGLNKFDPATETFTRYYQDPTDPHSLGGNAFSVVDGFFEDQAGYLWFSTWTGGLNKFDPATETFTRYQHNPADPNSLINDVILKVAPSADGATLWLATPIGLDRFDLEREIFTHYRHDPTNSNSLSYNEVNSVYATTRDGQPVVWIGTGNGQLNQFDPATETFTHYQISQTKITEIYEADDGLLWLGTQGEGLFLFDPVSGAVVEQVRNEPGNPGSLGADLVNHIYQDRTGILWIATYTGGVSRLDPQQKAFRLYRHQPDAPNSLSSSEVYSLAIDQTGTLWIGTLDAGMNRFDPTTATFTRYLHDPTNPNSLSHNIVTDLLADSRGLIWITTVGGGLNKFDPATATFTHYRADPTNPNSPPSDGILTVFEDKAGILWLGTTDAGLSRFDPLQETFTNYRPDLSVPNSLSDTSVSAIFEDSQGRLWIGSKLGVDWFDPATEQFRNYRHDDRNPNSLSHNYVKGIYEDNAGILWLTTDVGLNRFDPATGEFRHYFKQDGLPSNQLGSILADDTGYLWLGTSGGLSRFDPHTETFRNYNHYDGLQGDIFYPYAAARAADGTLYFGGSNGLSVFHPAELTDNPYPPPVVLTELQLFNEPVTPGGTTPLPRQLGFIDMLTLTHDQSIIGFEFVALNYTAPEKNQYAYMLEGFDQDWTYADSSRRFARYTNLDPGRYTFRVKASNNDGVWNETGAAVDIRILPPWWETIWFRGLALALVVVLVLGGFQWRLWRIKQQQIWLEDQVDRRTRELQASEAALRQAKQAAEAANQAKSVFLAKMSHELRTPLNTILGYAHILHSRFAANYELGQGLQTIQRSGDHLLALIDDVLDIARVEAERVDLHATHVNLPDFLGEIAEIIRLRTERKGLAFLFETVEFRVPEPLSEPVPAAAANGNAMLPTTVYGDARRLRQILLNLLTNAVKFTDQGRVILRVGRVVSQSSVLQFQVEDTGPGIAAEDLDRIFEPFQQVRQQHQSVKGVGLGLTISRHLVQIMGGTLRVTSTPGQGSLFWFDLPLPEVVAADSDGEATRRIIGVQGRQPKILVVDDIAENRAVIVKQLAPLGFALTEASDAAAALASVTECPPDLIIVDLMLPDHSGLDLIQFLRQHPTFNAMVMLVSSASVFAEDRHNSLVAGADDFLPKPVKPGQLLGMLERHLHLQWHYANGNGQEHTDESPLNALDLSAANLPPQAEIAQLYELAMMGHAAALQTRAAELARADERFAPFATRVERWARRLQISEICMFLGQYLER